MATKSRIKLVSLLLAVVLILPMIAAGCSTKEESGNEATTHASTAAATTAAEEVKEVPPVKLTIFTSNSGILFPDDVDLSNNPYLNWIEKKANVDLEVTMPPYADFKTKLDLMLASGSTTDIVHSWHGSDINKYGSEGAFIDWTPYIEKSALINKLYTKDAFELMKTSDGKIYAFVSLDDSSGKGLITRNDLLDEINGGVVPKTPDEWYAYMKKIKEKYPDAVPFATAKLKAGNMFFRAYGVRMGDAGAEWQFENGKFISAFESANAKKSIEYHKRLYDEGILNSTFATDTSADRAKLVDLNRGCLQVGDAGQFVRSARESYEKATAGNATQSKEGFMTFVPFPVEPGTDLENVYIRKSELGLHSMAINSKCKGIDAAVRVVEAYLDPEFIDIYSWGLEGINYVVKPDGKKLVDLDVAFNTRYRFSYGFMRMFWNKQALDVKLETEANPFIPLDLKEKFNGYWVKGFDIVKKEYTSIAAVDPLQRIPVRADLVPKIAEAKEASLQIIFKAIMGEIKMDEYDAQVKDYLSKYQFITDEYNKMYSEYLAKAK